MIAVVALQHPNGRVAAADTATHTVVHTHTVTSTPSPHRSPSTGASSGAPGGATGHTRSSASSGASSTASSTAAERLPLIVLNNTTISGLAESAAHRFEEGGWTVTRYGNLTNNILSTCAYYDPSVSGAQTAARALQKEFPTIKRVKPKFAELPAGPIVVVLTPDYS